MEPSRHLKESLVMKHPNGRQRRLQWGRKGLISVLAWNAFARRTQQNKLQPLADMWAAAKSHSSLLTFTWLRVLQSSKHARQRRTPVYMCCSYDWFMSFWTFKPICHELGLPSTMQWCIFHMFIISWWPYLQSFSRLPAISQYHCCQDLFMWGFSPFIMCNSDLLLF